MGLDLEIRKEGKYHTTKTGKRWFRTTILCSLRNCWEFLQHLNYTSNLSNTSCVSYTANQLWKAAEEIENKREYEVVIANLKEANIKKKKEDDFDTWYEVFAWW